MSIRPFDLNFRGLIGPAGAVQVRRVFENPMKRGAGLEAELAGRGSLGLRTYAPSRRPFEPASLARPPATSSAFQIHSRNTRLAWRASEKPITLAPEYDEQR